MNVVKINIEIKAYLHQKKRAKIHEYNKVYADMLNLILEAFQFCKAMAIDISNHKSLLNYLMVVQCLLFARFNMGQKS